jgi:Peptidase family M1 domain
MKTAGRLGVLVAVTVIAFQVVGSAGARTTPHTAANSRLTGAYNASAITFLKRHAPVLADMTTPLSTQDTCSSGAHSLSTFGSRLYPEMGNGGYTSLHTDLYLDYDAVANQFLSGTHANLTVQSTQCLSDLSFDFEQTNGHTADGSGPNMTVNSVEVNGQPASFHFAQPTYPGDPNGQDDPDPAAHAVSNANPVSAANPNPPACSPQVNNNTQNGLQCPANKLVVVPASPIPSGTTFTVTIDYTGRPGVHTDGDGSTEGWFRIATAGSEGSFVTTEPVGNDSWMPMNNFPTAKPTYDIYDTTNIGKVAIGPGELVGYTAPVGTTYQPVPAPPSNAPDANFPSGSVTWHWHSPEHIANYLVENSIGAYNLSARTSPTSGVQYWEAQASTITAARQATNKIAMDNQEDIVNFQTIFNGPWPMTTDGVVVGTPSASFEEEMQGKITFAGGSIGGTNGTSLGTFNHENMHQWFGDNVSESSFNMTFWKEGFATLGEYLNNARGTPPGISGGPAFETSLKNQFNTTYGTTSTSFWTVAPSNPTVGNLFSNANTYTRPGTTYLALWQTLGRDNMIAAMHDIQSTYGGGNITEPQLEQIFRNHLPVPSSSCNQRLDQFFPQWFDTAFPNGGANTTNKPKITGPGLNGTGFVCATVSPASPDTNGWYTSPPTVTWSGYGASAFSKTGCVDGSVTTEGTNVLSCSVTTTAAPILSSGAVSETIKLDTLAPVTTATLTPGLHNGWYPSPTLTLAGDDGPGSGIAHTDYSLDGGPWTTYSGPISGFSTGNHFVQYHSTDNVGHTESTQMLAFKVDAQAPTVNIAQPVDGAVYKLDATKNASYKCTDNQSGMDTCVGNVASGSPVDTSTIGTHAFAVTGTDKAGNVTTKTVHYTVVYTFQGFFNPIGNDADSSLNLVHAGDLIKIGFGLDGDRGPSVGTFSSTAVPCPMWLPHSVKNAGAGTPTGLTFSASSGHYSYGWQTSSAWAGTCRQFSLQLNDGTAPHTATFEFFS